MTRRDPETRRLLAGEYALGVLRGAARARFERWRQEDPEIDREARAWEQRLNVLAEGATELTPSPRVWREIDRRTRAVTGRESLWSRMGFWKGMALGASALAAALVLFIAVGPAPLMAPRASAPGMSPTHMAVMMDAEQRPAWLVRADMAKGMIAVEPLMVGLVPPNKSLELWLLGPEGSKPMSLGMVNPKAKEDMSIAGLPAQDRSEARAFAISLEPQGGSPTKQPTGPILYHGAMMSTTL